mgnify:CR=1 FL=1
MTLQQIDGEETGAAGRPDATIVGHIVDTDDGALVGMSGSWHAVQCAALIAPYMLSAMDQLGDHVGGGQAKGVAPRCNRHPLDPVVAPCRWLDYRD